MAKLNLNTYPYYDDFDLDKNFHKVLFKPGFAVQARELTQLQTILQDQIKRFGDNIFKEGSVISGCPESTNFNVDVIKILDTDTTGAEVTFATLESYVGSTFIGRNNGVKAIVKKVADGSETTDYKAVFLQYISQGTNGTSSTFEADEIIELSTDSDITLVVADNSQNPIAKGSLFSVGDGIVYVDGHFVRHYTQTIVLEKYSSIPSRKVGFLVSETIVSSDDDETLLDPAQGSFNYTAPGADRYKLSTELVSYRLNDVVEGFYILYEVDAGQISRRYDRTQYAELNKTLARRTYDESGDYVVQPFTYHIREHLKTADNDGVYTVAQGGTATKLALGVEPGKAYVRGFEYELFATKYVGVDKPTETLQRNDIRISTAYGNYFVVNEVSGEMPVDGTLVDLVGVAQTSITDGTYSTRTGIIATGDVTTGSPGTIGYTSHPFSNGDVVTYDAQGGTAITGLTDGADYYVVTANANDFQLSLTSGGSAISLTGTGNSNQTIRHKSIGTARVASIEYASGTPGLAGGEYRLYLYDVNMTGGSVSQVRAVCGYNTDPILFADIADVTDGAILQERVYTPFIFRTTYDYAKSLSPDGDNNSFVYRKLFTGRTIAADGSGSVTLTSGDETFSFTSNTNATILDEFMVIAEDEITDGSTTFAKGKIIDMTATTATVSPGSTTINFNILTTGSITTPSPSVSVVASVAKNDVAPRTKTLNANRFIRLITTNKLGYVSAGTYLTATATTGSANIAFSYNASVDITKALDCPVGSLIYTDGNVLLGTVSDVTPKNDGTSTGPIIQLTANSAANATTTSSTPLKVVHPNWDLQANKFTSDPSLGLYDIFAIDHVKVGSPITSWADIQSSGTNVTTSFKVKNGQTDTFYGIGSISGYFEAEKRYVIQLDHFEHGAGSFFTVDSYPLPTQGVSPTANVQIDWHQVPSYVGTNSVKYNLRDCVDFRNTVANIATSTTTLVLSDINPAGYTPSTRDFTGFTPFYIPHAQEEFLTDVEWNLPRIDRIVLDVDGNFVAVEGVASDAPEEPNVPTNCMNLGTIVLPPYPALSPKVAKEESRPRFAARFRGAALQRRYTMADIGQIDSRITNLERYTKLSFLEQKTINTLLYNAAGDERFKNGVLVDSFERAEKINYDSLVNNCFVGDGILTARSEIDPIDLEYSGDSTNVYLKPQDAQIVVRQSAAADIFVATETVTQATSGATGEVEHAVEIARGGNYKWYRLYLKDVTGTFAANTAYAISGGISGATGVITYTGITNAILAPAFRPDLISVPSDGELATLPYEHLVYTENPYASETVTVTNDVVYGYEGSIGLNPAEDVWFEHRVQPQIINQYDNQILYKEKEIIKDVIATKEIEILTDLPTCMLPPTRTKCIDPPPPKPPVPPPPPPPPPPPQPPKPADPPVPKSTEGNGDGTLPPDPTPPPAEQQRGGNRDYGAEWIDESMYDRERERAGTYAIRAQIGQFAE